jgi:hypothetical protein
MERRLSDSAINGNVQRNPLLRTGVGGDMPSRSYAVDGRDVDNFSAAATGFQVLFEHLANNVLHRKQDCACVDTEAKRDQRRDHD